ncbi:hypothetical protein O181_007774 [Austropuccinia psidii MF-1]|uniref:Reverse transcriptase Ty1/copia-type domain-containing protein n=1 Tax=Austropuccinia psidii MF-1 TaxID=1389203 RepID=A0A9Q3BLI1_9BASI|nr:hypothetical protein [Austropuccinia psidii MF-1]
MQSILTIASKLSWKINTFYVTSAYLHSKIDQTIFVKLPPGVTIGENKVLKLKKTLYGLKQVGRYWCIHLKEILKEIGFKENENDQSRYVYKHGEDYDILWIQVDNGILVTRNDTIMEMLKFKLTERFKLRWDKDINSEVGIEINREGTGFILKQPRLIKKLIQATDSHSTESKPLPEIKLKSSPASQIKHKYLLAIGMILYLSQAMRPDVMYAVNYLARFAINTKHEHWKELKNLVDYISTAKHQASQVGVDNARRSMDVYIDANWGGEGSRSQHGFCIVLYGTMVAWNLKMKSCITILTCQAEYMALSFEAREVLWLVSNMEDMIGHQCPALLLENRSEIQIANKSSRKRKSRHIQREFHIINELEVSGKLTIDWISTTDNMADIFTKWQRKIKTSKFRDCMDGLWGWVLRRNLKIMMIVSNYTNPI